MVVIASGARQSLLRDCFGASPLAMTEWETGDRTRDRIQETVIGPPSPFPSPSRGEGFVRTLQSSVDLFLTQTSDLHDFVAGTLASENFELRLRKTEKIR